MLFGALFFRKKTLDAVHVEAAWVVATKLCSIGRLLGNRSKLEEISINFSHSTKLYMA